MVEISTVGSAVVPQLRKQLKLWHHQGRLQFIPHLLVQRDTCVCVAMCKVLGISEHPRWLAKGTRNVKSTRQVIRKESHPRPLQFKETLNSRAEEMRGEGCHTWATSEYRAPIAETPRGSSQCELPASPPPWNSSGPPRHRLPCLSPRSLPAESRTSYSLSSDYWFQCSGTEARGRLGEAEMQRRKKKQRWQEASAGVQVAVWWEP